MDADAVILCLLKPLCKVVAISVSDFVVRREQSLPHILMGGQSSFVSQSFQSYRYSDGWKVPNWHVELLLRLFALYRC